MGLAEFPHPQLKKQSGWLVPRRADAAERETLRGVEICRMSGRALDLKLRSLLLIGPQGPSEAGTSPWRLAYLYDLARSA